MGQVKVTKDLENSTLVLERTFNGPVDKVWKAYSDKNTFESWWGPEGWETEAKIFDFSVGGAVHYEMRCVDERQTDWFGKSAWGLMDIRTIDAPKSFSYIDYFSDESGKKDTDMPTQNVTVELAEEDGQTVMTIRAVAETAEQIEELVRMGMVQGFDSQMNKLDKLLAE